MRLGRTSKKNISKASIKTKALTIAECKVSSVMSRVVRIIINAIRSTDTAIFRLVANTYSTRRNTQHAIMLKSRKIEKQITGYLSEL